MRRHRCIPTLGLACAVLAAGLAPAHEPDGRVAFRYDWSEPRESGAPPTLRLTLTLRAPLDAIHLSASIPSTASVRLLSARRFAGAPFEGVGDSAWPPEGLSLGALSAGAIVVIDLAVEPPASGGGILSFGLDASSGSAAVHEGVGIPVGTPGVTPVLRNGAVEFPAGRVEPRP